MFVFVDGRRTHVALPARRRGIKTTITLFMRCLVGSRGSDGESESPRVPKAYKIYRSAPRGRGPHRVRIIKYYYARILGERRYGFGGAVRTLLSNVFSIATFGKVDVKLSMLYNPLSHIE